jgi:DNA repair protein RecO (recombination protein O)
MSLLDMEIYFKPSRELQLLREFSFAYPLHDLNSNIRKSSVALFLGEVLSSVLREESPNEALFSFIENSIEWFDESRDRYFNFHIAFLAGLSRYLGFEPRVHRNDDEKFFDLVNGSFVRAVPVHGQYAPEDISSMLFLFLRSSIQQSGDIPLNGKQRNELLETLVRFYSVHLPALGNLKSLEILKDVFG